MITDISAVCDTQTIPMYAFTAGIFFITVENTQKQLLHAEVNVVCCHNYHSKNCTVLMSVLYVIKYENTEECI